MNNRKLAFRIWLPILNRMIYDIRAGNGGVDWQDEKGTWWYLDDDDKMQYTGLHDKNGAEIYEGDIIQIMTPFSEKHLARVVWDIADSMSMWQVGETWMLHFLNGVAQDKNAPLYPYCQPRSGVEVTVIGNIYEHPELLEKQA